MTRDRGRSSSSDDLLREARQRVLDGDLYSDDYVQSPDEDRYGIDGADHVSDEFDADELSAVDIAEALAEEQAKSNPQPESVVESPVAATDDDRPADTRAAMGSLPGWAVDDDQPSHRERESAVAADPAEAADASSPLAERIRLLAIQQDQQGAQPDMDQRPLQTPPPPAGERDFWSTPSEAWQSRPPPTQKSGMTTAWIKPAIFLAVFAFVSIGFFASVFDGREAIDDVAIGDCFESGGATEIYTVPIVDCSELHSSELYATVDIDVFDSDFPGADPLNEWINARCEEDFPEYVGEPYENSRYWIEVIQPTEAGWEEGDRVGLCTVVLVDDDYEVRPALGSARDWGERT